MADYILSDKSPRHSRYGFASGLSGFNGNLAGLGFFRFGNFHLQNPMLKSGGDTAFIHVLGQSEGAVELAEYRS